MKMSKFEKKESSVGISSNNGNVLTVFVVLVAITLIIVVAAILIFNYIIKNSNKMLKNITIKNIDVSDLSKEEAMKKVEEIISDEMSNHIVLKYNNYQYYVEPEQFEAKFDIESAVDYAFKFGKSEDLIQNLKDYKNIVFNRNEC